MYITPSLIEKILIVLLGCLEVKGIYTLGTENKRIKMYMFKCKYHGYKISRRHGFYEFLRCNECDADIGIMDNSTIYINGGEITNG